MYFRQLTPGLPRASAAVPDVRLVRKFDRRDVSARAALAARVTGEFHEMPGLCITLLQAQRLFGLREAFVCASWTASFSTGRSV